MKNKATLSPALFAVALTACSSIAHAEIGPAMTGLAGNANDAMTVFTSPAGITRMDQSEIVVQTIIAYTESKFSVDNTSVSGGDGSRDQTVTPIPGLFYVKPIDEKWWFGASLNVPSGLGFDFGRKWAGRYHATETQLAFLAASAVFAYKVNDQLSVAAGPYVMFVDSQSEAMVNNLVPDYGDGRVELEETGADMGYTFGVMYEFSETTRVAASYHSELKPDLDGKPKFYGLDPLLTDALQAADLLGSTVKVDFRIPAIAQCGFYHELSDQWSMTGDLIWIDMSQFGITNLQVEEDSISGDSKFRDMWITSWGLKYRYGDQRAISVGGLYATSGVSDKNRTIALPIDSIIGAGIGYQRPVKDYLMHVNLNVFDLGDGDVNEQDNTLAGDFSGSFDRNYAIMLDIQFKKQF